jgi:hypothetical protein
MPTPLILLYPLLLAAVLELLSLELLTPIQPPLLVALLRSIPPVLRVITVAI